MRQRVQADLSFAVSLDETPHERQCNHVLKAYRASLKLDAAPTEPRRCLGFKMIMGGDFCHIHDASDDPLWARRRAEWSTSCV